MFSFKRKNEKIKSFDQTEKYLKSLEQRVEQLEEEIKKEKAALKKASLIRYSPFKGEGGDQSFSLALLDEEDKGFTLTAIYTHEGVRVFAKPVVKGESPYQFSEEEKEAIKKAKEDYDKRNNN